MSAESPFSDRQEPAEEFDDLYVLPAEQAGDPFHVIDWQEFWAEGDDDDEDRWLLAPVIPKARAMALFAGAKVGKSDLMLWLVICMVTGRDLHGHKVEPIHVLLLDFEMTVADVRDRLEDFGIGPEVDLSHLHYASLPDLPGLDTFAGGRIVVEKALEVGAGFVVIDTTGRAVIGEENSADTYRGFSKFTGQRLKAAGIGYARLDHAGKDPTKGQRGSSAKSEDVDVVLELTRSEGGAVLKATHRRMSWYPQVTNLARIEDDVSGQVIYRSTSYSYPPGTAEVVDLLDGLDVPLDLPARKAMAVLRENGQGRRSEIVNVAVKFRRERRDER